MQANGCESSPPGDCSPAQHWLHSGRRTVPTRCQEPGYARAPADFDRVRREVMATADRWRAMDTPT